MNSVKTQITKKVSLPTKTKWTIKKKRQTTTKTNTTTKANTNDKTLNGRKLELARQYLVNPICNLTPLFDIDYTKKQNLVSVCLFKMDTGGYKNFKKYTDGITNLSKLVKQLLPDFRIRLFIDNTIYEDDKIMVLIKSIDNIDCVLYHCPNFIKVRNNKDYHIGVFGTIIRCLPIFDFPNNDAKHVFIFDVDIDNITKSSESYKRLNEYNIITKLYPDLSETYLAIHGRAYKNDDVINQNYRQPKNDIMPYIIIQKIINFKKLPASLFIDFMNHIYAKRIIYSTYKITKETRDKKCSEYICFGLDEYFINNIVIQYLVKHKLPILVRYTYHILQPFFYYKENPKNINKFKNYIQNLLLGVKYSGNPLEFIDKLFYDTNNNPIKKLSPTAFKVANNYYRLIIQLYKDEDYSIIYKDFILLSLTNTIYGAVSLDKYISYNNPRIPGQIVNLIKSPNIEPLNPEIIKKIN